MTEHTVSLLCAVSILILGFLLGLAILGVDFFPRDWAKKLNNRQSHTGAGRWHW